MLQIYTTWQEVINPNTYKISRELLSQSYLHEYLPHFERRNRSKLTSKITYPIVNMHLISFIMVHIVGRISTMNKCGRYKSTVAREKATYKAGLYYWNIANTDYFLDWYLTYHGPKVLKYWRFIKAIIKWSYTKYNHYDVVCFKFSSSKTQVYSCHITSLDRSRV